MKVLKKILIVLVILIALPLIIALFVNGEYAVVRDVTINKPKPEVFDYIKYLRNQDNFSVWNQMDPNMKKGLTGTDGEVGAVASWESDVDSVGKGEQEIIKIADGERIDFELRFKEPFESTDYAYFTTEAVGDNQTRVQWGFNGKMPYPMNLMMLFMNMEEMLAPDLERGLANLKVVMEKMPSTPAVDITEMEVESKPILYINEKAKFDMAEISQKISGAYGEIGALMSVAKVEMTDAPMAITNEFSMENMTWDFDCAIVAQLPEGTEVSGRIQSGMTYAGKVVKAVHIGPYQTSMNTYQAIEKYMKEKGLEQNGRSWEEYIDDPMKVKPEELRTNIYYPVK